MINSIMAAICLTATIISSTVAQPMPEYTLDEVVVTANRTPSALSSLNRSVQVITRSQIASSPADNLPDLLEYAIGVDLQTRGPLGVQADAGIRGSGFDQTLVLIDGVKVSDPQTGHHLLNIPLSLHDVERVEILRGHGSRLYGPNALGEVINIITRKSAQKSLSLDLDGGGYGLFGGTISAGMPIGKTTHQVTASRRKSDGYIEHSEFDETSLSHGGGWSFK